MDDVEYYINGVNFKDYGVYVSASKGVIGQLERKDTLISDWNDYHGLHRDCGHAYYKERLIELTCFVEAYSRTDLVEKVMGFMSIFSVSKSNRLKISYNGNSKPLLYEVVLFSESDVTKKWGATHDEIMVGTFTLKLIEDEPVKKVLRYISGTSNSNATITVTTPKFLNIYWGDGSRSLNVRGNNTTVEHTYALPGEYDIIVTGVIEDIEQFTTNATIIWELLK